MDKHGDANRKNQTRLYRICCNMKSRCDNPNFPRYRDYGGRGVVICIEWRFNYPTFRDWALANGYTLKLTIERKENDGPYSPENCIWIPLEEQARNRRNNRLLTIFGETKTVVEWSEDIRCQVSHSLLRNRLHNEWTAERAITEPATIVAAPVARLITHQNITLSLNAWAVRLGLKPAILYNRLYRGLSPDKILAPVKQVAPYGSRKIKTSA